MVKRRVLGVQKSNSVSGELGNVGSSPSVQNGTKENKKSVSDPDHGCNIGEDVPPVNEGSTEIFCPICSEKMLTLAQLNQHLDDEHALDSDSSGDSVTNNDRDKTGKPETMAIQGDLGNWVKKSLIESFIGPSEVTSPAKASNVSHESYISDSASSSKEMLPKKSRRKVHIPRSHWQKPSGDDHCHYSRCNRKLGLKNGLVNCRKCGKLFCNQHTTYRMKLNCDLESDPVTGVWCRVCVGCFKERPCWNQPNTGYEHDLTLSFRKLRSINSDLSSLSKLNLEKRLFKLVDYLKMVDCGKMDYKEYVVQEKELVPWNDGPSSAVCNICHRKFSFFLRRHHCRICGSTVCDDVNSGCSMAVPVDMIVQLLDITLPDEVSNRAYSSTKFPESKTVKNMSIRICIRCKRVLFDKRLSYREQDRLGRSEFVSTYAKFRALTGVIDNVDKDSNDTKLINYFSHIEQMTKQFGQRIKIMDKGGKNGQSEIQICKSLQSLMIGYIQENMPRLRCIQKKRIEEEKRLKAKQKDYANGNSPASNGQKKENKLTLREIRLKREKLMVLMEQKYMIENLHETYKKQRKFDDLRALDDNLKDLNKEIDTIHDEIGSEAFN